jgi:hypothetical protein
MLLRLAVRPWGVCEAVGTTVGEAVGVSSDGVLAGGTMSETVDGVGDGEFVVRLWATPTSSDRWRGRGDGAAGGVTVGETVDEAIGHGLGRLV